MSRHRPLSAVVMAAGEGTRMKSARPKPLHVLCGRPMLLHVLDALAPLPLERAVVVVGHGAESVTKTLLEEGPPDLNIDFVDQRAQRGTGDAASVALTVFPDDEIDDGDVIVLPGDTPLIRPETLAALVTTHREEDAACTVLVARRAEPDGYGIVIRGRDDRVTAIVDEPWTHDLDGDEAGALGPVEVNTSIYCFRRSLLAPALRRLSPENAQGEYFLSYVVAVLPDAGHMVLGHVVLDAAETAGVIDRVQLAAIEAELRRRINRRLLETGVTILDPERTYVDTKVSVAADVTLFPGTMLHGHTVIGPGARIGPDTRLVDCAVGADAVVEHTVGRDAEIGEGAVVGPFAHLPPGSHVSPGERTGAFYTAHGGDEG
jgi:bifunctional UDP-N-acetylglucosamine pyrophosphorylase/glucosamine-1-phosphate N-acetyltransferase